MLTSRTPHSKRNDSESEATSSSPGAWRDVHLSPMGWSQPPAAMPLGDDEISPTSVVPSTPSSLPKRSAIFSFASPRPLKTYFSPKAARPGGYSHNNPTVTENYGNLLDSNAKESNKIATNRRNTIMALAVASILVFFGASSWNSLLVNSHDPPLAVPPPGSLSEQAQAAFARLYPRDFGAAPSLFVIMEASDSQRLAREQQQLDLSLYHENSLEDSEDSYSFTDDTSEVYSQGKAFATGLTNYLIEQFSSTMDSMEHDRKEVLSSVQLTTYYSLQERGLDYLARNMVAPDGSQTIIQIQYLRDEVGGTDGVQKLKQEILKYGQENAPSSLDLHFTGQTWNPSLTVQRSTSMAFGFAVLLVGTLLYATLGLAHSVTQWYLLASGSMVSSLSTGAIVLAHAITATTPLALSTMAMVSVVLSIIFAKLHIDANNGVYTASEIRSAMLQTGLVLMVTSSSLFTFSSPTVQSVGAATALAVATSVSFYICMAPQLVWRLNGVSARNPRVFKETPRQSRKSRQNASTDKMSNLRSLAVLVATGLCLFPLVYQIRNLPCLTIDGIAPTNFLTGLSSDRFRATGESLGHGRLTPYRILFDGSKVNQKMVTLGGYDIVQMVVDELLGISISEENKDLLSDDPGVAGSTHIGEETTEVQHLIKDLIDILTRFKTEQQREFDKHHRKREARWREQQKYEDNYNRFLSTMEDIRCEYNVNSGLHATTYSGMAVLENARIPQKLHSTAKMCRTSNPKCPSEALHLLNFLEDITTTPDQLSTFVTVNLGVDPFSWKGIEWLRLARETIERLQKDPRILGGTEIHIDGPPAVVEDLYNTEHRNLQQQLLLAGAIVTVALAITYRDIVVPLQIMTHGFTALAFSLGMGNWIYRKGALNWLHLSILSSKSQGGSGMTAFPVTMICVLVTFSILISDILSTRLKNSQGSLTPCLAVISGGLSILELVLLSPKNGALQWPLIVALALCFEGFWIRQFVMPAISEYLQRSLSSTNIVRHIDTAFGGDVSSQTKDHAAYVEKFDGFIRSPHAP